MSPHDRYLNDPVFHRLVQALLTEIETASVTPTEVREAAMVAQVIFESRRPFISTDPILLEWFQKREGR